MALSDTQPQRRNATVVSFAAALFLLVCVAAFSMFSVREFQATEAWRSHTHQVLLTLEETYSTERDVVALSRRYAATGKAEYIERFNAGVASLAQLQAALRDLLADNPPQLERLARLNTLVARRVRLARTLIDDRSSESDPINVDEGLGAQIRRVFSQMKETESRLLELRSADTEVHATLTKVAFVFGNLLSIVILLFTFSRLQREVLERRLAQMQAQKNARETEDIYNKAPCGYYSVDIEGTLVRINDTALTWLGYTREEVLGKMKSTDMMTPESRRFYEMESFPQFLRTGRVEGSELRLLRKDGTTFIGSFNATTVRDANNRYLMSRTVFYDVSERRRSETEIGSLNDALRKRAAQLELVNKELERFSYSVSHDLRAPLRVIGGYALMLEEDYAPVLGADGKRYIDVIRSNTRKMDTLIVDLLKLAKSSLTELVMSTVDMRQMATQVANELPVVGVKPDMRIGDLHPVEGNVLLLRQVWENLLGNAAKFSANNPNPVVIVTSAQSPLETVYRVEDNGVGFDMQHAQKLFEVFHRLHAQEQFPGTGVGLALVKRIITRHGGRVWATSESGAGAVFYFSLPRTPVCEADKTPGTDADYRRAPAATSVADAPHVSAGATSPDTPRENQHQNQRQDKTA